MEYRRPFCGKVSTKSTQSDHFCCVCPPGSRQNRRWDSSQGGVLSWVLHGVVGSTKKCQVLFQGLFDVECRRPLRGYTFLETRLTCHLCWTFPLGRTSRFSFGAPLGLELVRGREGYMTRQVMRTAVSATKTKICTPRGVNRHPVVPVTYQVILEPGLGRFHFLISNSPECILV